MIKRTLFITKKSWSYWERHCKGKIKHVAIHQAQTHCDDLKRKKPAEDFNFYQCRFCGKLHVGHVKTNPTQQEQAIRAVVRHLRNTRSRCRNGNGGSIRKLTKPV